MTNDDIIAEVACDDSAVAVDGDELDG